MYIRNKLTIPTNMSNNKMNKTGPIKVVIVGNSGVGKSCIISQFAFNIFDDNSTASLGALCISKVLDIEKYGTSVQFHLWDTAGQEVFRSLVPAYYKSAQAVIVAYSVDNRKSFEDAEIWIKEVKENAPDDVKLFIVANKSDLIEKQKVSIEEGKEFATSYNSSFHLTSAKLNTGIEDLFVAVAISLNAIGSKESEKPSLKSDIEHRIRHSSVKLSRSSLSKQHNCC